ncbi:MAG TPA: hypothetical protein VMQ93_16230 [Novosphingobium sp.]|nr:hypothetical protein [Novosphingobium sp.]
MPADNFATIRPRNVVILVKLETTPGVDALPTADDAIPFENDGWSYNSPYTAEDSNEANGSLVAGAPLIVGRPAEVSIRVRIKGAGPGKVYSPTVKPPHHVLFECTGRRGLFTAAIAAGGTTGGTTSGLTLGTSFAAIARSYIGMPLVLSGGNSGGRLVHVTDYTAGRAATFADVFATALDVGVNAAMPANWTYAGTSPKSAAARLTDQPSATVYIYEDGILHKFVGCRGNMSDFGGQTARPGYATFALTGIYNGFSDADVPVVSVPGHSAPTLNMGAGGVTPALVINRKELKVSTWSLNDTQEKANTDDPNTPFGFGTPELGGRAPALVIDPLKTFKANRDPISDIEQGVSYTGVVRHGAAVANRWSLTTPYLMIAGIENGTRDIYRKEDLTLRALNPGLDAAGRDGEAVLCFY